MAICKHCGREISQGENHVWYAKDDDILFMNFCDAKSGEIFHAPKERPIPYAVYMMESMVPETICPLDWVGVYAARAINHYAGFCKWADAQNSHDICLLTITCENEPDLKDWIDFSQTYAELMDIDDRLLSYM